MSSRCASSPVPSARTSRVQRLRDALAALQERYGPRSIRLGADFFDLSAPRADGADRPLTTGSLSLDLIATGLPRGGITEYAGIDGAGKESLALAALVACQRSGGGVLLVDADNAGDFDALAAAGVNLDALVLACPPTAAEAWHILTAVSAADALDLVVLFSLSALLGFPDSGWGAHGLPYASG